MRVTDPDAGTKYLNKVEIRRETGLTLYYIDRAIEALRREGVDVKPKIEPGRANEKLFSPDQVRAIQKKAQAMLEQKQAEG